MIRVVPAFVQKHNSNIFIIIYNNNTSTILLCTKQMVYLRWRATGFEITLSYFYIMSLLITNANNNIVISTCENALSGFFKCCKIFSYYTILYAFAHSVRIIVKCVYSTKLIKWMKESFFFVALSTISNTFFYVSIIPLIYYAQFFVVIYLFI